MHGELAKVTSSDDRNNPDYIKELPLDVPIRIGDKAVDGSQLRPYIVWFGEYVSQQSDKIGVHIGCISRDYPKFDEFDASDNRQFQNYIFKTEPLTEEMMIEAHRIPARTNFCMVNEDIPESELPVLYYSGSGKYMFLATKKRKRG